MNTNDSKTSSFEDEMNASKLCKSLLDETLREGAQKLLKLAIENEVEEYIQAHRDKLDNDGKRLVVRNGHHCKLDIQTGVGTVEIEQPRVRDKRPGKGFNSSILPKYMRRWREGKLSRKSLLLDAKDRGLTTAPKLTIADGALGF